MNQFLTAYCFLFAALCALNATAFVPSQGMSSFASAKASTGASPFLETTSLNMVRVKVDPNEKEERLNPAVFKNAAYLGSIAVAVLLPIFFLIAASK